MTTMGMRVIRAGHDTQNTSNIASKKPKGSAVWRKPKNRCHAHSCSQQLARPRRMTSALTMGVVSIRVPWENERVILLARVSLDRINVEPRNLITLVE